MVTKISTFLRAFGVAYLVGTLAGCAALPTEGPGAADVLAAHNSSAPPYAVVDLTPEIADLLSVGDLDLFTDTFGSGTTAPSLRIGIGDTLTVSIFEAAAGGLFSGEPGSIGAASKNISMPGQVVSQNGAVNVPFAGRIQAAGRTTAEVARSIEEALSTKAIQPQVLVTVSSPTSTAITVSGDVGRAGQQPLDLGGQRLLDAIAEAGGSRNPDFETFVRITRGTASATMSLTAIVQNPDQNIYLRPGDQIFVYTDPATFTVFGATTGNSVIPFNAPRLTIAEAIGRSGGLIDDRADPRGVFVFRYEDPSVLEVVTSRYTALVTGARVQYISSLPSAGVPVVYRLDLKDPVGYFAAQRFAMKDGDVLYVSNAPAIEMVKFLDLLRAGTSTAGTFTDSARDIQLLTQ